MIKAVLFDRDDTLTLTHWEVYDEAAEFLSKEYGLDKEAARRGLLETWAKHGGQWAQVHTKEDETEYWRTYVGKLGEALGCELDEAQVLGAFPYEKYMKAVPDAAVVLQELRARGLKIGVLSNTLPSIDRTLREVGLNEWIDVALATCVLGIHKPAPEAFLWAVLELGVAAEDVLFVDDLEENIAAAKACGLKAVRIKHGAGGDGVLGGLREILTLV